MTLHHHLNALGELLAVGLLAAWAATCTWPLPLPPCSDATVLGVALRRLGALCLLTAAAAYAIHGWGTT